jgi:hypothetical protein
MNKDRQFVLSAISELKSKRGGFKQKAERNLRIYEDSLNISLDDVNYENIVGFYKNGSQYDTTVDMSLNIIKSCIDTLVSKIASTKVRPHFNTVNGSFKDVRIAKQAQQYFDQKFESKDINKQVSECFRCACIFDTGIIYIDPIDKSIRNVLPWQVYFRPAEKTYGHITRVYYERKQFPTTLLEGYTGTEEYIGYGVYYDIINHVWAEMYSTGEVKVHDYQADVVPFVFMNYTPPIIGTSSNSIVDMLLAIQIEINQLANTVKDASQLSPANTILVPQGTNINIRKLNNGIGNVIGYSMSGNIPASPITVATPSFIDPQYMKTIEELKETAYELVGISQLSATSQKPQGLNSAVGLKTLESIESDRFETQLNSVIKAYTDITKICMKVYDPDEDILPGDQFRSTITWKDICREDKNMKIQYSSMDAISKDPTTKMQILQQMAVMGIIPANTISQYLEMPDIDKSYSRQNNNWNAVQTVIERCIDSDIYEVPAFVPIDYLEMEIINTQLSLFSSNPDDNIDDINKLTKLFQVCLRMQNRIAQAMEAKQQEVNQQYAEEMGE